MDTETRPLYMLSTGDPPQNKGHIQTESEGLEKYIPCILIILINDYLKHKWVECPNQRLAEWIQKQDPYICCLQETHFKTGDTYRLKVKGWKKYSTQIETKRKQE